MAHKLKWTVFIFFTNVSLENDGPIEDAWIVTMIAQRQYGGNGDGVASTTTMMIIKKNEKKTHGGSFS